MVFESVLTQVLNKVLGAYVENLDTNQLRVGIWGGDVELNDLVLKQSALDDLDLPLQTIYGRIGKLVLKIPWKNLYGAAFVINVEDIYLLAAPNQQVKYDAVKEANKQLDAKMKEILKVELAKQQEADKDKPKADYTFVEKLITQIIKNIQLNIKNIHIRYEDKVTSPKPFAMGITLSDLHVVSTDENWTPAITKEDITKIFKVIQLDGLAVYWNSNTSCYDQLSRVDLLHKMCSEIASRGHTPNNYTYVVGPINASARIRINQKPELDQPAFTIPKIHLNLEMERLFVGITKAQYRDVIALADSMDRMAKGVPYRKYRPDIVGYKGHFKEWWHFAYNSILEEEVRRRRRNWDWDHICKHRGMCKEYAVLYEKKLDNKASTLDIKRIEECERNIDVFNLVIIRQRVEMEVEKRLQKKKSEEKGWFGWMWGGGSSQKLTASESNLELRKQFEEAMTKEEKERLYKAIGYQENVLPGQFPQDYIDNSCTFLLRTLEIELRDDSSQNLERVVFTELKDVLVRFDTRAAANALKVWVKINEFTTYGLQQDDYIPRIITSDTDAGDTGLLEVTFETNPLDNTCGQRLYVKSQPLKIVYDGQTVIKAVEIFKVPSSGAIDQLSAMAEGGISNIKEKSSTGLQYAIDSHVHLDLNIDLRAPYIILPYGGKYNEDVNVLVVNLGNFRMKSEPRTDVMDMRTMHSKGFSEKRIREQLMLQSYDTFTVELSHIQVLVAQSYENWNHHIKETKTSDMHLLDPISVKVSIAKCMISDDPNLPLTKITGELPQIAMRISDARLLLLMSLITSINFPGDETPEPLTLEKAAKKTSSSMVLKYFEMQESAAKTKDKLQTKKKNLMQFTTVQMKFVMSELSVHIRHQISIESPATQIASFSAKNLEVRLIQQTYNTKIAVRLAGIGLLQSFENQDIKMISSPGFEDEQQCLFEIDFSQVNKNSPEFHTVYKSCETTLGLKFSQLGIILHKDALLQLIQFVTTLQTDIDDIWCTKRVGDASSAPSFSTQLSTISEGIVAQVAEDVKKKSKKPTQIVVETIKFKLSASLSEISLELQTKEERLTSWSLHGINTEITVKESYTQIHAVLNQITITDLNPQNIHDLILTVKGKEAISAKIVLYNLEADVESDKADMSVDVTMGGLRIVFLNWFISRILDFLNEFQAAQSAIVEASQAAAQTARENVQNAYAKATKLSLNIDLRAPDIIIPENSKSYDAVLLDLGRISITNKFITLDIKNEQNFSAVVDEMNLSLTDLKISRIKLNKTHEVENELKLLTPLTFKMSIKRNLSSSWYKAVPEIDIHGRIFSIVLQLSQIDYKTIMSILNENLAEGAKKIEPKPIDKTKEMETAKPVVEVATSVKTEEVQEKDIRPSTLLRCTFTMDNLVIGLYTGGCKELSSTSPTHDSNNGLARFSLEGLSVKVRMLADQSINASILLLNCLLDDLRPGREDKLKRLVQRTIEQNPSSTFTQSMIDVMVQMTGNDIFAEVRVFSFTLILSVDYLLKIADFLAVPKTDEAVPPPVVQQLQAQRSNATVRKLSMAAPKQEEKKTGQITLNLKIEQPDIVLVEHMDSPDAQALVLNSQVLVKLRMAGPHQVLNGTIQDLQLYTCSYNQMKRVDMRNMVLHPVSLNVAGSTPEDRGLHLELLVTDVRLCVSPSTIELLSRVVATATGSTVTDDTIEETIYEHEDAWDSKPLREQDFWFFRIDEGIEIDESSKSDSIISKPNSKEMCIVSLPTITITMEAGVGAKTLPMLVIESGLRGRVNNWSSNLSAEAFMTLQMNYYNSRLAVWEPLIEPVQIIQAGKSKWMPWELKLAISMNEKEDVTSPSGEFESIESQQAQMCVDITSEHILELVVTKTCLEVLNNLGKAFATAMKPGEQVASIEGVSPYKIMNELGASIQVDLEKGNFTLEGATEVVLGSGAEVHLQKRQGEVVSPTVGKLSQQLNQDVNNSYVNIKVTDKNCDLELPVTRADKRYFSLNYRGEGNDTWGLISDVLVENGVTVVTIRSILQVYNHFHIPIEVYYMTPKGNELACITTAQPDSHVNIPINAVYTATSELFFSVEGYSVSTVPYVWKNLQTDVTISQTLICTPKTQDKGTEPFVLQVVGETEQVYFENTNKHTIHSTCYNIHLRPSVVFKNCLPVDVICCVENMISEWPVAPGATLLMPNIQPGKSVLVVRMPSYLEKEWSCRQTLEKVPSEFNVWNFNSYDSANQMTLALGMHSISKKGSTVMTLYCPFWMINKTGLSLSYRKSKKGDSGGGSSQSGDEALNVLYHPADFKGPILFSFNAKNFFGKKKAAVRIQQGDWSDKFSLDVAGSSGVVACKTEGRLYQLGVQNQLTYNGLTKQVTFTPYFVIINNAPFGIECQESDRPADPWICIEPKSCTPFWPKSELDDKLLKLRVKDTQQLSGRFLYTESHTSLLKLKNKYGGVNVDIQITEGSTYINLAPYEGGSAPALLINHTRDTMHIWEKESIQIKELPSKHSMLYTWDNPSGPRIMVWEGVNKKEHSNDLRKDDLGEYRIRENYEIFWVSFLDGMQRILLFTEDQEVAQNAKAANLFETFQQEITISICGLGVSLVNNFNRQEIMYMAIASSGIIWEQCKMSGKRYKYFGAKESMVLEAAYQRYLVEKDTAESSKIRIDSKTEVDFDANLMFRPNKRKIRRTFETGLWIQMKTSPSQLQLHAKVNRLQIDNQMFDCIFPVVLAPVPLPKSVAANSGRKPFVELSVVQLLLKNSQVKQFKYFKVLIQEFHVKVDLGFVNALVDVLESSEYGEEEERRLFAEEVERAGGELFALVSTQSLQEQKSFYDLLHFSPLKIHVSFSIAAGTSAGQTNLAATPNFLNVLMQGLGVTLTDMQDVIFRLAYFEREYTFLTQKQLVSEATRHYVGQSVKQLYVLVLGLDVLGNPYGLVRGITQGVEDLFYEPFQGAIQGPGEFAEGLVLGVRSLFGHTVGGAAGAVSRITGAMGKGIAALTFDEDYQRKRRDQINKKPATVQEGIARSGKGLVMGVVDGVTGVFTKPISGAKEEGFGGFFKGLGKGAVGLVARPTAGVIDFASGSLDAVKRVTEMGEEAGRLRLPRFLPQDGLVKPYNKQEAQGYKILIDLEKGKYATTDVYDSHYNIVEKREVLLLTDKRLAFVTHNDLFGGWQLEWSYTWAELKQPPSVVPKGVAIVTHEKKKKLSLLGSTDGGKIILISDPEKKEEICTKIETLRVNV